MKGRRRMQLVHGATALRALLEGRIRELPDGLEPVSARLALIFVKRHRYSSRSPLFSPSISARCSQNGAVPLPSSVSWNVFSENALPCSCL